MITQRLLSFVYFVIICLITLYMNDSVSFSFGTEGHKKVRAINPNITINSYESAVAESLTVLSRQRFGFDTIGGMNQMKKDLLWYIVLPMKNPTMYSNPFLRPPHTFLFEGVPGTGKTLLARAVAAEAGVSLLALKMTSIENKYVGESAKFLRAAFTLCEKLKRCILFIDEIDGAFGRVRSALDSQHDYGLKTILLQLFDEFASVTVICATNHSSSLDPALVRRFDSRMIFEVPNDHERSQILAKLLKDETTKVPKRIWKLTKDYTPSNLRRLVETTRSNRNRRVFEAHAHLLPKYLANPHRLPRIKSCDWNI